MPIYSLTPNQLEALVDLQRLRKEAEREVERLICFLDMVDGYSLSECEPSLGYPEPNITSDYSSSPHGALRTDEGDQSDQRGFGCTDDRENGLPAPIEFVDRFGDRDVDELEEEHDGREPDVCDEPNLGSVGGSSSGSQEAWAAGDHSCDHWVYLNDRELDDSDLEPSLCGVTATAIPTINSVEDGEDDAGDDREIENEHSDSSDDEPSLCGVGSHEFQPEPEAWKRDLELEADGPALVFA